MKIHQLSLFLENRPGQLKIPCRLLAEAGINIQTLSLADTEQFGILRLIVKDWERAQVVLQQAGCVVNISEVVAVEVEDRPGGLAEILATVEEAGLNLEYMYAFTFGKENKAALIFRFEEIDKAVSKMKEKGINLIEGVDLFERCERG